MWNFVVVIIMTHDRVVVYSSEVLNKARSSTKNIPFREAGVGLEWVGERNEHAKLFFYFYSHQSTTYSTRVFISVYAGVVCVCTFMDFAYFVIIKLEGGTPPQLQQINDIHG